jgi:DNA (cytosine-5)-methyltransferase 1
VDLFSGAGGLSQGLTQAGWVVAAAVDHNPHALRTHQANFSGLTLDLDLGDRRDRDQLVGLLGGASVDLVAGGPPCQPFSRAGRSKIRSLVEAGTRDPEDHRRELWRAFVEIVERVQPRAVLMENVPDMALADDLHVVRQIVYRLEAAGYRTEVNLVDAGRYGVPQHRQRLILLARRDDGAFTWPPMGDRQPTVRDAIADLPRLGRDNTGGRVLPHDATVLSPFARAMRHGAEKGVVHDHMTRPVRPDDYEIFQLMDSTTLYSTIPEEMRRYKADTFDDKYKRLDWDAPSRSITAHIAKDGYWYIHPEEHRTITVREAARIQTFPDWFRFAGRRSDAFRQIGNAVPPLLGEAAARAVAPVRPGTPSPPVDRTDWVALHRRLARWAAGQRRGEHWYLVPGPDITPPLALVVSLLRGITGLADVLEPLRGTTTLDPEHLGRVRERLSTAATRRALDRALLAAHQSDTGDGIEWEQLVSRARLKPAELGLFLVLTGQPDQLLTGQGSVRVAARVLGTNSHQANRLTAGRLDLARLVGAGPNAPARVAAIRLLGATLCVPQAPDASRCAICPLRSTCRSAVGLQTGPPHESSDTTGGLVNVCADLALPDTDDMPAGVL